MGALVVARGDIWWGETPDTKGRPYLVMSRDAANAVLPRVLVAPVTRRVRELPSELRLGRTEGLAVDSVASFDNLQPFVKALLTRRLGMLGPDRMHELCAVIDATFDC